MKTTVNSTTSESIGFVPDGTERKQELTSKFGFIGLRASTAEKSKPSKRKDEIFSKITVKMDLFREQTSRMVGASLRFSPAISTYGEPKN